MTRAISGGVPARQLRLSALGGGAFTLLYLVHRLLQGLGPADASATTVAAYQIDHRAALLTSEVVVGLALLAFLGFLAPLVPVLWRAGQQTMAMAVLLTGGVFVALGFVSNAAETALVAVADSHQPAAVLALNQLQGRTPIVWTIAALVPAVSVAVLRTGIAWRWLGYAGLGAAVLFGLGSVFSEFGDTPESNTSLIGVGLFIVWMLLLSVAFWRSARTAGDTAPG